MVWRLIGIAVGLSGILLAMHPPGEWPEAIPADAPDLVGQTVRMEGVVHSIRATATGHAWTLAKDGSAIHALSAPVTLRSGDHVAAIGRIADLGGRWTLMVEQVDVAMPKDPESVPIGTIAAAPWEWTDREILVKGHVQGDRLAHGDARLPLGAGAWPEATDVQAVGALVHHADCVCYRFHAATIHPWTPPS